jgi:dipeptidyl aminopeptidase/acylaminoacyl peptidase
MFRAKRFRFVTILLLASLALGQSPTRRLLRVDDMHRFQDVRDVQISPEGRWVAYTLTSTDTTADKSDTDVWMVSWDGKQQLRLTSSPDNENAPRWSPDGHYLSFISGRKGKAKGTQVWLLDRMGGEAQQLTDVKGRISSYSWSPDSKRLLLVMTERDPNEPDDEASGPSPSTTPSPAAATPGASPSPTPAKAPKPIVIDRYHFKQDEFGYLTQKPARLFLVDIATKKTDSLTAETVEASSPTWSPNGQSIAFLGKEGKDAERYNIWNLYVIDAQGGATAKPLTHYDGIHSSASRAQPEWSPDGTRLVYLQSTGAKYDAYNMNRLAVVTSAGGGEPTVLTSSFDRGVSAPRFSADGSSILFLVSDDRSQYPARIPANGGAIERLVKTSGVVSTLVQGKDGRLAVLAATDNTVNEVQALENGILRPLTHHNDALLAEFKLGATEEFSCKSKDGNEVHGLIVKPPDYEPGKKYPTLLRIHGGPNGQDQHSFSFERQIFAANGYVVVAVNYRGSSGRGEKYQTAIASDWGNKEVVDLQAAIDHVISIGLADPDHLGVGGWSYGGILTDAIIAKDHRFKAATSGAGTAFPIALYGVDQYIIQYDEEIGAPWKVGLDPWIKISYPFLHADQITTPTLFMGGEKDFNVPLVGGEQMYQALSSLGVPTQLVVYPGEKHGIVRPSYQKDRVERYLAWYAKYVKPPAALATSDASGKSGR